jgi:hypothetical protein
MYTRKHIYIYTYICVHINRSIDGENKGEGTGGLKILLADYIALGTVNIYICIHVYIHVYIHINVYVYICIHIYVCMWTFVYMFMLHIYSHIYIYVDTCIYTYRYT